MKTRTRKSGSFRPASLLVAGLLGAFAAGTARAQVEAWRQKLHRDWKALPEPPITAYSGPFGDEARAFVGKIGDHPEIANIPSSTSPGRPWPLARLRSRSP